MNAEWVEMWRINLRCEPEMVRIMPATAAGDFVLVEGEDHTSYRGNFYSTPDDAFKAAVESCERSIRYNNRKIEELNRGYLRAATRKVAK